MSQNFIFREGLRHLISNAVISSVTLCKQHYFNNTKFCSAGIALVVAVVTQPFSKEMGAWQKTTEPQKLGNSPGPGSEVAEKQLVA